jgi:hypothetical protein
MKCNLKLLGGIALATIVSGCQSIPQAGLIYASKVDIGLAVEIAPLATAAATEPLKLTLGFGSSDIAYVPVAVMGQHSDRGSGISKIWSSHDEVSVDCKAARKKPINEAKAAIAEDCETRRDAMSVYGQFNGSTNAGIGEKKYGLTAGRVFATGVAAQHLTEAASNVVNVQCIDAVKTALGDKATAEAVSNELKLYCRPSK